MNNANDLTGKANQLIGDNEEELQKTLKELRVVTQNLKVTTTYAKSLTGTLARKPWRIVWGGETPELPEEKEILDADQPIPLAIPEK